MSEAKSFLSVKEEHEIVDAIRIAEQNTSGEIRVHIEANAGNDPYKRALEVFHTLKMFNTKQQNAVLFYVAINDKKFVVFGDKGINEAVSEHFWDTTKNAMQKQFEKGFFKQGIIEGILKAGEELKTYFPWNTNDEDELSNEISKG